jgi:hypothetical protein
LPGSFNWSCNGTPMQTTSEYEATKMYLEELAVMRMCKRKSDSDTLAPF